MLYSKTNTEPGCLIVFKYCPDGASTGKGDWVVARPAPITEYLYPKHQYERAHHFMNYQRIYLFLILPNCNLVSVHFQSHEKPVEDTLSKTKRLQEYGRFPNNINLNMQLYTQYQRKTYIFVTCRKRKVWVPSRPKGTFLNITKGEGWERQERKYL